MLHGKPLHPAANSENVHGLGIAEQRVIMARISTEPKAFYTSGPDRFGLYYAYYPQDISLHTEYTPGYHSGVQHSIRHRAPNFDAGKKGGDASIT